jgi:hypothetical protein
MFMTSNNYLEENVFLHGELADEPEYVHVTCLADTVCTILRLRVHGRVPIRIVEHNGVSADQVDAKTTRARRKYERKHFGITVELIHHALPVLDLHNTVTHTRTFTRTNNITVMSLSFHPIRQNATVSVTEACTRRPGAAASMSDRRRECRTLLASGGRRASRSHTLAASHAFELMQTLFCHTVKM